MKSLFRISVLFVLLTASINVTAQYVDFGRNKVQYKNFDWHTLSTPHFKVYYYPEMQELAEIGAAYAEESYKQHVQDFNYSLIDTVPLIFYATPTHFRETNTTPGLIPDAVGGFTEFIKGRVVIPYDGSLGNFKHVIRHELTHVFMMAKIGNVLRLHKQSLDKQPPLWFTEGLAEAWSEQWDETAEMVIKDAVLNGYMVGLSDWETFYGTFFMYKMGQSAILYMQEKFGHEKVLELMDNFWMSNNFSDVMNVTIGEDYSAFDKEWLYYLKKKYYPTLSTDDNPSANTEKVFTDGFGYKPAYWNDGKNEYIYFIGNRTGYTSLFRVNLKDKKKNAELVIEGERSEEFEAFHFFRTGIGISKKGILAFATKSGENDALHFYDIKRDDMLDDYHFKNIVQIGSPSFSPDGNKITFEALDIGGKADIYVFDLKSEKLNRLTNDYYDDRDPDFSPDGKTIVFSSDRTAYGIENKYNLFLYNLDNQSISYLTNGNEVDYEPQFSDDGKKIIYTSTIGGCQNVWLIDIGSLLNTGGDTAAFRDL
ncbi:MAG: TolB family protein, partial [Ignavibacteria bacterium]